MAHINKNFVFILMKTINILVLIQLYFVVSLVEKLILNGKLFDVLGCKVRETSKFYDF